MELFLCSILGLTAIRLSTAGSITRRRLNATICTLPSSFTYNLPPDFRGNVSQSFIQTTFSANALSSCENELLITYDPEFTSLFAANATLDLIYADPNGNPVADEMGIWVWDHNEVWMASASEGNIS